MNQQRKTGKKLRKNTTLQMVKIETYLKELSSLYYISHNLMERNAINTIIGNLETKLKAYFKNDIVEIKIFGSWKRDTTLPRKYDIKSDVDVMIIFDHYRLNKTPETYRTWLLKFANSNYVRSTTAKDFPTVRIDLYRITLDLIPTKKYILFGTSFQIPDKKNKWMYTDPDSFTNAVIRKNTMNGSRVKPVLRLIKAWNNHNGRPFDSYVLEKYVLENIWWGFYSSIEKSFFAACNSLSATSGTLIQNQKVKALQSHIAKVKICLENDNLPKAKEWLHKVLPK